MREESVTKQLPLERRENQPSNQKKKNLYSSFQIQLTPFTGKKGFSPQPLHKEGGVGGQQRRTKQKLTHLFPSHLSPGTQQTGPFPDTLSQLQVGDLSCCTTSWGLISNTISLERAWPYLLQSSCCGLLSARSKES